MLSDQAIEQDYQEKSETSGEKFEEGQKRKEVLQDKIDNMLLENEMENEDMLSLSHSLRVNVKISYDLKSLLKSDNIYDVEPDLIDVSLTNEQYLNN